MITQPTINLFPVFSCALPYLRTP